MPHFTDWRCPNCGRMLAEVALNDGAVRRKCDHCKQFVTVEVRPPVARGLNGTTIELSGT